MMVTNRRFDQVVTDLQAWKEETERMLPYLPQSIAVVEMSGDVVDLRTGLVTLGIASDGVQTLDNADWLAGLEQACGGSVRVAWAMRPEVYFAQAE